MPEPRQGPRQGPSGESLQASPGATDETLTADAPAAAAASRGVALFDFDATLTRRDTLVPWLVTLRGRRRVLNALMVASMASVGGRRVRGVLADQRTRFKESLFRRLLAGVTRGEAEEAADRLAGRLAWRSEMLDRVRFHRSQGHLVAIATGSPGVVVNRLARRLCPPDHLIATDLEIGPDGRLTGRLAGANCVRVDKARRVKAWLAELGPVGATYGYGNHPHDLPMLALVDHPRVV